MTENFALQSYEKKGKSRYNPVFSMRKGYAFAQHIASNYFTLSPQRLTHRASMPSK